MARLEKEKAEKEELIKTITQNFSEKHSVSQNIF